MIKEGFGKLNLPEDELLETKTDDFHYSNESHPVENNIKIDSAAIKDTGKKTVSVAKSLWEQIKSFRERQQKSHSIEGSHDSPPSHSAVPELTHIHSAVEKDPELKTIEELKDPKLASYPILDPKTVELIQSNAKEDADRDMKNLKRIVDPDVEVPKDLPQREKDPFIVPEDGSPLAGKAAKPDAKHPSWMCRNVLLLWSLTKKGTKRVYHVIVDSDMGLQILGVSLAAGSFIV